MSVSQAAQSSLNAFTAFDEDKTLSMEQAADDRLSKGEGGLLTGAPLAIKDLFAVEGVSTTASSHILDGFKPAYESTVTSKLWDEGAVFLAKTSMDEFAMGSSNETAFTGPVNNPWRGAGGEMLTPGGSSGGSASAVAADLCFGGDGNRYRRLDPPAGQFHRYGRREGYVRGAPPAGAWWPSPLRWITRVPLPKRSRTAPFFSRPCPDTIRKIPPPCRMRCRTGSPVSASPSKG